MSYTYIPAKHHGGSQDSWDRVVIHGTVSGTLCGGARDIARYFQDPTYVSSAHYVVDPCEVIQCVWDHTIAYHAPPNRGSIGVELCDPVDAPGDRWQDADHQTMLALAAEVTRKRCAQKDVPLVKRNGRELHAGKRGICGHDDVRDAWGQTDHRDPGPDFPWEQFIAFVRGEEKTKEPGMSLILSLYSADDTEIPADSVHCPQFETEHVDRDNKHGNNWRSFRVREPSYYLVSIEAGMWGENKNARVGVSRHEGELPVGDDNMTHKQLSGQTFRDRGGWTMGTFSRPLWLTPDFHYAVRVENYGDEPVTLTRCHLTLTKIG